VFDHTVKPVLLYGSEIWGFFPGKKLVFNADSFFYKLCKNVIIENVHKKFCKFLLEVTKCASNIAVMGELGRYPLYIDIFINMVNYYIRLLKSDGLFFEAYFHILVQNYHEIILDAIWLHILFSICLINIS
jgi:hypothetical protein